MSKLNFNEKKSFRDLFEMGGGTVLDFSNADFAEFFRDFEIDIYDPKYHCNKRSDSKANCLRGFWEVEDDTKVGNALDKLIDHAERLKHEEKETKPITAKDRNLIVECRNIVNRLLGIPTNNRSKKTVISTKEFLDVDFEEININMLPIESKLYPILQERLYEVQKCWDAEAYLAAIFMAGSILEGVLLGIAQQQPDIFNKCSSSPKKHGKVKNFDEWTLDDFIVVSNKIGLLGDEAEGFSHGLRNFRNFIHPHKQLATKFQPTKKTTKLCLQAFEIALSHLTATAK